jgi:hypothetical protein
VQGLLWDWYRSLQQEGWALDANSYSTCFRVKGTPAKSAADLQRVIDTRPRQLACTFNIGVADFYPTGSGKEKAAAYLTSRWGLGRGAG